MNVIKNVLSWAFALALIAMIFSPPQARADGVHGVRETAREILVDVPKFCRPLTVVWEAQWEQNADNEDMMLSFTRKEKGAKITVDYLRPGAMKIRVLWLGGETVRIPKMDAKGRPIKIELLTMLALGGGEKLMNEKNWGFTFVVGKEGDIFSRGERSMHISPPVNVGTWGKCT